MTQCIIGTTLLIESNMRRYIDWINYYGEMFPEHDLILVNDGDSREERLLSASIMNMVPELYAERIVFIFNKDRLGRKQNTIFPGWRRSFREGLRYATSTGYDKIAFIETDLYIREKFIEKYAKVMFTDGYYSGYDKKCGFMEPSIQVLNNPELVDEIIKYYDDELALNSDVASELQLQRAFNPNPIFIGERLDIHSDNMDSYEYYGQCNYNQYKKWIRES